MYLELETTEKAKILDFLSERLEQEGHSLVTLQNKGWLYHASATWGEEEPAT